MKSNLQQIINVTAVVALLATASAVFAKPDTDRVPATNNRSGRSVTIPKHAVEVGDNVFSLGTAIDPATGKTVEGYMIINKRDNARGGSRGKPDSGDSGSGTCYAFMASGARWKVAENYIVDPSNIDSLSDSFVRNSITSAVNTWDNEVEFDVFGPEGSAVVDGEDTVSPDGKNEILFADIDSPGAVGVTIVWGIFRGKPANRELVEWDQVYDDVDFDFGDATVDPSIMDLPNVAAHEVGHAAGLGHPSDNCTDETMYRFVTTGETKKRDLNTGDITGINALYR